MILFLVVWLSYYWFVCLFVLYIILAYIFMFWFGSDGRTHVVSTHVGYSVHMLSLLLCCNLLAIDLHVQYQ